TTTISGVTNREELGESSGAQRPEARPDAIRWPKMEEAAILFSTAGGIATLTLNRPQRLNAITWPMMEEMLTRVREVAADEAIRLLVFKGKGRAFSSGDDIVDGMGERRLGGNPEGITADRGLHYELVKSILEAPKPTVAAINGRCHGAAWVI